jgi:hypothetical protein
VCVCALNHTSTRSAHECSDAPVAWLTVLLVLLQRLERSVSRGARATAHDDAAAAAGVARSAVTTLDTVLGVASADKHTDAHTEDESDRDTQRLADCVQQLRARRSVEAGECVRCSCVRTHTTHTQSSIRPHAPARHCSRGCSLRAVRCACGRARVR